MEVLVSMDDRGERLGTAAPSPRTLHLPGGQRPLVPMQTLGEREREKDGKALWRLNQLALRAAEPRTGSSPERRGEGWRRKARLQAAGAGGGRDSARAVGCAGEWGVMANSTGSLSEMRKMF